MSNSVRILSVPGPALNSNYYPLNPVPGGPEYLEHSLEHLQKIAPDWNFDVCLVHPIEWGDWTPRLKSSGQLQFCIHRPSLEKDVCIGNMLHPSAQHGALLNWLVKKHPNANSPIIVMDPDFFVLSREALHIVLGALSKQILTAGVTYSPLRSLSFYMDFPVVFFQSFSSAEGLDFSPEGQGPLFREKTIPFDTSKILLGRLISKIIGTLEGRKVRLALPRFLFALLFRILLHKGHRSRNLHRDTGYKNRINIGPENSFTIGPVDVSTVRMPKLEIDLFLKKNPLFSTMAPEKLAWYAHRYGLMEGRDFSGQRIFLRILAKIARKDTQISEPFKVELLDQLHLDSRQKQVVRELMRLGVDFYALEGKLLGAHLGSESKKRIIKSIGSLSNLTRTLQTLV